MAKYPWRPTAVCACHAAGRWPGDFFNGDHRAIAASGVAIAHMSSRQRRLSSCSLLPISSVILRVGQDVIKTEDSLRLVVYPCGQTILLARDLSTTCLTNMLLKIYPAIIVHRGCAPASSVIKYLQLGQSDYAPGARRTIPQKGRWCCSANRRNRCCLRPVRTVQTNV